MGYRINGFEQIKKFYEWVFNNPEKIRPTHISLYLFLLNQNNRANWVEWFKCPYDLAMQGACIGNNGTYYKCLDDLKQWNLIDYHKGINNYKAPLVKLKLLYNSEQVTVPLTEQLTEQVTEQLTEQLPVHIYKLITNNLKPITDNYKRVEEFILNLNKKESKEKVFKFLYEVKKLGVDKQIAEDWMKVRRAKGGANTETAFKAIEKEIGLSGLSANECVRIAVENNWRTVKAEWIKNIAPPQQKKLVSQLTAEDKEY